MSKCPYCVHDCGRPAFVSVKIILKWIGDKDNMARPFRLNQKPGYHTMWIGHACIDNAVAQVRKTWSTDEAEIVKVWPGNFLGDGEFYPDEIPEEAYFRLA